MDYIVKSQWNLLHEEVEKMMNGHHQCNDITNHSSINYSLQNHCKFKSVIIQHESLSRTQFKHCRNKFLCKPRKGEH